MILLSEAKLSFNSPVAGANDDYLQFHLPKKLKTDFHEACGHAAMAARIRELMVPFVEFAEEHNRPPANFAELCAWHAARRKKK